jgi:hypothetical protein
MIRKEIITKRTGVPAVQEQWPQLTRSDIEFVAAHRSGLARQVAKRYGLAVGEAKQAVNDFLLLGGQAGKKRQLKRLEPEAPASARRGRLVAKVGTYVVEAKSAGGLGGESGTKPKRTRAGAGGRFGQRVTKTKRTTARAGGLAGKSGTRPKR